MVVAFGDMQLEFRRTFRNPNDGIIYPLLALVGTFPLYTVARYDLPAEVKAVGGLMIAMYQSEALWFSFGPSKRPVAARIFSRGVNIISGNADLLAGRMDSSGRGSFGRIRRRIALLSLGNS
ncbi:hypothetical protein FRB93_010549 [Tulasnella sp. JGI-2019a]|nr:hypothetical protein FRB93_010549 [Tulasnella sp. JGI-2019a]